MAARKPLVRVGGLLRQLPATDVVIPNPRQVFEAAQDMDLGAASSDYLQIEMPNGGQPITIQTLGDSPSGMEKAVYFGNVFGGMALRNWGPLSLPGGANIAVEVGDCALFRSNGNNAWVCLVYQRASGKALVGTGSPDPTKVPLDGSMQMTGALSEATMVSASVDGSGYIQLASYPANTLQLTTAMTIQRLVGGKQSEVRRLRINSANVVLVNSGQLRLLTGANIACAAGDIATFQKFSPVEDIWDLIDYTRANGQALVAGSTGPTSTDGLPEGSTNLYFTQNRVRATALTGVNTSLSGAVAATDTMLQALGKLQRQASALAGQVPGQTYMEGLLIIWNGDASISVSPGTAYIPSAARQCTLSAASTLSGMSLSATTWYHVYLTYNSANDAVGVEAVTTAPSAAYAGDARTKQGDTSRRYLGSLLTDGSAKLRNFQQVDSKFFYLGTDANIGGPPFRVLSAGTATAGASVPMGGIIPPTAKSAVVRYGAPADAAGRLSNGKVVGAIGASGGTNPAFLFAIAPGTNITTDVPVDSNNAVVYWNAVATSSGAAMDVYGYTIGR